MSTTKTLTPLSALPVGTKPGQIAIGKCSEVLPNHMQCWRAGDVVVTVVNEPTTAEDGKVTQQILTYQKCNRHALAEQEQYTKEKTATQETALETKTVLESEKKVTTNATDKSASAKIVQHKRGAGYGNSNTTSDC